ncbi:hypothetical protein K461DRAFT_292394 [Myriangium duriaei CBS 260.36]|uniref:Rhodopsin domain-containing protein n=1 Tax=Myriangium duriaei CBS 260.36 TaxID=1168546 RepID=A0A9P4J575_9PEZI|nr:hypothetical protein K461DRAFT_292394 [Myriangium duriaei CBS 260.36]
MARFGGDGPMILIVGTVLTVLALICIVLRAFVASRVNNQWRWDFIWVAASGLFGIVSTIAIDVATLYGLGNDVHNLTFPDIFEIVHWSYISIFLALIATTFAKWSLIALMLQVQGPNAHKRRIALWLIGGLGAVVNLIQLILSATQCEPNDRLWYRLKAGTCPRQTLSENFSIFQGAGSALTDIILALWPISIVYKLQTTMRVKVMFCCLMGLGILPMIASVLRTSFVPGINSSPNVTRAFGPFMLWIVIELWVIVILTSIPVLRPLFLKIFYGIKTSRASRSTNPNGLTGGTKPDHISQHKSAPVTLELDEVDSQDDDDTRIIVSKSYRVTGEDHC